MEINYSTCKIKQLREPRLTECMLCVFKSDDNHVFPVCKTTGRICQPVQDFINHELHGK
jgi:hypothetical protein